MNIKNEDIREVTLEVPEGHTHLRTTILLKDGTELVFQEAAIANIVRAYVTITTHPVKRRVTLMGKKLAARKEEYAEWQLVETEEEKEN